MLFLVKYNKWRKQALKIHLFLHFYSYDVVSLIPFNSIKSINKSIASLQEKILVGDSRYKS